MPPNTPFAYVCHHLSDEDFMVRLRDDFQSTNVSLWTNETDLMPETQAWKDQVVGAIENATCVLFMVSPQSLEASTVEFEIRTAQLLNKPIIALHIEGDLPPPAFPIEAWLPFRDESIYSESFAKLTERLHRFISPDPDAEYISAEESTSQWLPKPVRNLSSGWRVFAILLVGWLVVSIFGAYFGTTISEGLYTGDFVYRSSEWNSHHRIHVVFISAQGILGGFISAYALHTVFPTLQLVSYLHLISGFGLAIGSWFIYAAQNEQTSIIYWFGILFGLLWAALAFARFNPLLSGKFYPTFGLGNVLYLVILGYILVILIRIIFVIFAADIGFPNRRIYVAMLYWTFHAWVLGVGWTLLLYLRLMAHLDRKTHLIHL